MTNDYIEEWDSLTMKERAEAIDWKCSFYLPEDKDDEDGTCLTCRVCCLGEQ